MQETSENSELARLLEGMLLPEKASEPISQLSAAEWRAVKDTVWWQEFSHALEVQLESVHQAYDDADGIEQLRLLQGQAKVLRSMQSYPDEIAELIEGMKDFNQETGNGNGI